MEIDVQQPQKRVRSPEEQAEINERMARVRSRKAALRDARKSASAANMPIVEEENQTMGQLRPPLPSAPAPIHIHHDSVAVPRVFKEMGNSPASTSSNDGFTMDPNEIAHIPPISSVPPSVVSVDTGDISIDGNHNEENHDDVEPTSGRLDMDRFPPPQRSAVPHRSSSIFTIRCLLDYLKLLGRGSAIMAVLCFCFKLYTHHKAQGSQSDLCPEQQQVETVSKSVPPVEQSPVQPLIISRRAEHEPRFLDSNAAFSWR